jgi:plasmid stabilization system protein ParE
MRELTLTDATLRNLDEIFLHLSEQTEDLDQARQLVEQCEKMAAMPIVLGRRGTSSSRVYGAFPFEDT